MVIFIYRTEKGIIHKVLQHVQDAFFLIFSVDFVFFLCLLFSEYKSVQILRTTLNYKDNLHDQNIEEHN